MKVHPVALLQKVSAVIVTVMKPLGIWGLGGLALLDSAMVPIPGGLDGMLVPYVTARPSWFLLYCLMGAAAAAVGSLVPFYLGRAGGELFLLKRINRERYEKLRDRFERQEFLAILLPSMGPPPTPLKVFQFAAGVFEMKPLNFMAATFLGKFIQFVIWSILLIRFGPKIAHTVMHAFRDHLRLLLSAGGILLLILALYVTRRVFDKRNGVALPIEQEQGPQA